MLIIIAPAKQMFADDYAPAPLHLPRFQAEASMLATKLAALSIAELQALYRSSLAIAQQNFARLQHFNEQTLLPALTPALFAYQGLQYRSMSAKVLTQAQYAWLDAHLCILSALYGLLRPFDGVKPYRLEMQARFVPQEGQTLYDFWRPRITAALIAHSGGQKHPLLINLASAEYSKAVDLQAFNCTQVSFYLKSGDKLAERGAWCKKARGAMVEHLAAKQATGVEAMQDFKAFDFKFAPDLSSAQHYVFIREA